MKNDSSAIPTYLQIELPLCMDLVKFIEVSLMDVNSCDMLS